jgi:hypothetical protein
VNNRLTARERAHLERVRRLQCSVCDAEGPSYAHHIEQGQQYTCVALCYDCHQGKHGWHGDKAFWKIRKMDELAALNETIERLVNATV